MPFRSDVLSVLSAVFGPTATQTHTPCGLLSVLPVSVVFQPTPRGYPVGECGGSGCPPDGAFPVNFNSDSTDSTDSNAHHTWVLDASDCWRCCRFWRGEERGTPSLLVGANARRGAGAVYPFLKKGGLFGPRRVLDVADAVPVRFPLPASFLSDLRAFQSPPAAYPRMNQRLAAVAPTVAHVGAARRPRDRNGSPTHLRIYSQYGYRVFDHVRPHLAKGRKTMSDKPDNYDPAMHPRQPDHSEFINRVSAAVSPVVPNEPAIHAPLDPNKRPDQGRAAPVVGFQRGPHD